MESRRIARDPFIHDASGVPDTTACEFATAGAKSRTPLRAAGSRRRRALSPRRHRQYDQHKALVHADATASRKQRHATAAARGDRTAATSHLDTPHATFWIWFVWKTREPVGTARVRVSRYNGVRVGGRCTSWRLGREIRSPCDEDGISAHVTLATWYMLTTLCPGGVAFALHPQKLSPLTVEDCLPTAVRSWLTVSP